MRSKVPVKILFQQKEFKLPVDPSSTVSELIKLVKERLKISGTLELKLDGCTLFEEDTLKDLEISPNSLISVHATTEEKIMQVIPPIESVKIHYKIINQPPKVLELLVTTSLKEVGNLIMKKEKVDDSFCMLFLDKMPLLSDTLTISDIKLQNGDALYALFLPLHLKEEKYDISMSLVSCYKCNEFWRPEKKQTDLAQSIFMCCLYSLGTHFKKSNIQYTQFFKVVRKYMDFSPSTLALFHLFNGNLMNFEKKLISLGFYHFLRNLLPLSIPDDELFQHAPEAMVFLLSQLDITNDDQDYYMEYSLLSPISQSLIKEAVMIKGNHNLWDKSELSNIDKKDRGGLCKIEFEDFQLIEIPEITALLKVIREKDARIQQYSTWESSTMIMKTSNVSRLSIQEFSKYEETLKTDSVYQIFTFISGEELNEKKLHNFLSIDQNGRCVFTCQGLKNSEKEFNVIDPFANGSSNAILKLDQFLNKDEFEKLKLPKSKGEDSRPIEQVDMVVYDISFSMESKFNSGLTRMEMSKALFGAFIDKYVAFSVPHVVGLICFGKKIHHAVEIQRNYDKFEKVLGNFSDLEGSTRLLPAIEAAIEDILQFKKNYYFKLDKNVKSRIVCFTDGEDNSNVSPYQVAVSLQKNNIVLDVISISENTPHNLRALSHVSGGSPLLVTSKEQGMTLFESEAMISLKEREEIPTPGMIGEDSFKNVLKNDQLYPMKKGITRKTFKQLELKALSPQKAHGSSGDGILSKSSRTKRIYMEFKKTTSSQSISQFKVFMTETDFNFWKVLYKGDVGTPYAGGNFVMYIHFPPLYPLNAPEVRFVTKIYHCNVNNEGKICHEIITTNWSPYTTVNSILENIADMLKDPNADDALDTIKGDLFKNDKEKYTSNALQWTQQFASKTEQELRKEYKME